MGVTVTQAGLLSTFVGAIPLIVIWVLTRLGIGIVSYVGLQHLFEQFKTLFAQAFALVPSGVIDLVAFLGVGQAVSIVISAIFIRFTIRGFKRVGFIG